MEKKYVIAGITCSFLLISGFCYSCSYNKNDSSAVLVSSLTDSEENTEIQSKESLVSDGTNSKELNAKEQNLNVQNSKEMNSQGINDSEQVFDDNGSSDVYVHICGAVAKPGVYQAAQGTRLYDMIELAGGLIKEAAGDYINQAQTVADGQRIYIPTKDEVKDISVTEYAAGKYLEDTQRDTANMDGSGHTTNLVNVNTATAEELMNLPGIGQAKADSIIDYRVSQGKFKTIEDLMKIPGIKEGLFGKISSYIIAK
jgi:competence protein ComEA